MKTPTKIEYLIFIIIFSAYGYAITVGAFA